MKAWPGAGGTSPPASEARCRRTHGGGSEALLEGVRLEARTDQGEVKTTKLVTFNRPVVDGTLADLGLALSEAKAVLAKLQASMV